MGFESRYLISTSTIESYFNKVKMKSYCYEELPEKEDLTSAKYILTQRWHQELDILIKENKITKEEQIQFKKMLASSDKETYYFIKDCLLKLLDEVKV